MTTLTYQAESGPDETGRTYGYEVFHDPAEGYWTTRFHIRTWDGLKVADSWTTGEVQLDATTPGGANAEAQRRLTEFRASLTPQL